MTDIEIPSVVALLEDLPADGLVRGQVGTVVESWAPGVYEVEFCDDQGKTYSMVALKANQLIRLHHEPVNQAATPAHPTVPAFRGRDRQVRGIKRRVSWPAPC